MLSFIKGLSSGIQSKYSIGQQSFQVGPWSVHDGKVRSSGEPVSVFVFEKSSLTKQLPQGVRKSVATQNVVDYAQRGVSELMKLRHPSIVRLVEPIESSSRSLIFVTERLTCSLETLLIAKRNESLGGEELNDLAIERGALVLCQGLRFLHDTGRVHTNLCPSSIFVASNGDWKIGGLEFLTEPSSDFFLPVIDPRLPNYLRLDLNFLAPETAIDHRLGIENDTWALACILFASYTLREPLDCRGNANSYKEEYTKFARKLRTMPPLAPRLSSALMGQLFERDPTQRLDIGAFEQTDYFNHSLVKALQFLDDFETKSSTDKTQFLKYLLEILPEFPKSILRRKVLQFVVKELSGPTCDPLCTEQLSNVLFAISSGLSQLTFQEEILPMFKSLGANQQFQDSLVSNVQVVVGTTSEKSFVKEVIPIFENILKGKENGNTQRELLNNFPIFVPHITLSCLEQKLFPLVLSLFRSTQVKSVKLSCIGAFSTMVSNKLSTLLLTDQLLPALQEMKTRDPLVVMAVKDLYESVAEKASSTIIMEKIMPHMCELSLSRDLTVPQFKSIVASMRNELAKFEAEQTKLLINNREENNTFNKESLASAPAASKDSFMSEAFKPQPKTSTDKAAPMDLFDDVPSAQHTQQSSWAPPLSAQTKPVAKPVAQPAAKPAAKPAVQPLAAPSTTAAVPNLSSQPKGPDYGRKPASDSFDDDFGSFNSTPSLQPLTLTPTAKSQNNSNTEAGGHSSSLGLQSQNGTKSSQGSQYTSPFLVSSLQKNDSGTTSTPNWNTTLQPQSRGSSSQPTSQPTPQQTSQPAAAQPSWMQPLQPTKR